MKKTLFIILLIISWTSVLAEKADSCFYLQVDMANRWIWRGVSYSGSPVIQPSIGYNANKLHLAIWGSYPFQPKEYKEIDFIAEYQLLKSLKIGFTDYFAVSDSVSHGFFDFNRRFTNHLFDIYTVINPFKKVPVSFMLSNWFWGADRDRETLKQNFSTYFEARYDKEVGNYTASAFTGMTFGKGFYASNAAIVNMGLGLSRDINVTNQFSIPAKIEFILNPNTKSIFINAIISIK